jgi:DNA replication protein DnaC
VLRLPAEYERMRVNTWEGAFPAALAAWEGSPPFVAICGEPGNGKTHLAVATLRRAADSWLVEEPSEQGSYRPLDAPSPIDLLPRLFVLPLVIERMRDLIEDGGDESLLRKLRLSRLAVIDEWGAERRTDWTADVTARVVIERYAQARPTIFTTNQTAEDLYKSEPRLGSRLLSGLVIECEGPDRRLEAIERRVVRVPGALGEDRRGGGG